MRVRLILCALALAGLQSGCSFFCYGARNMVEEPIEAIDRCLLTKRAKRMADTAWADVAKEEADKPFTYYYEDGFKCGFVDFILYNGNGEPPAAPPWIYRTFGFETPAGQDAVNEWFAAFRRGAVVAASTGYREASIILPIALPPRYSNERGAGIDQSANVDVPPTELHPPRKVPSLPLGPPDSSGPEQAGSRR